MAGGRGAKRKLKKLKRESEEAAAVLSQCIHILGLHGYVVSLPYEVPQILQKIIEGAPVAQASPGAPTTGRDSSLARLEMSLGGGGGASDSMFAEPEPEVEVGLDEMDFSGADFSSFDSTSSPVASSGGGGGGAAADGHMPPISIEEMGRRTEEANARMLDRVSSQGVRHKGSGPPGIEQGQRMQAADGSTGGSIDGEMGEAPAPSARGGRVNRVTGMSRDEAAGIIARVTGKSMDAPGGGPVAKPR